MLAGRVDDAIAIFGIAAHDDGQAVEAALPDLVERRRHPDMAIRHGCSIRFTVLGLH